MEEALFRQLFLVIYVIFFGVRIRYRVESARKDTEQPRKLSNAGKLQAIAILCYFASILLYLLDVPSVSWSRLGLPFWIRWFGVSLAIVATILVAWTHLALGRQYSAELVIQKDHILVTTGPYARIRHPMYTALNMFSISMAIITSNLLVLFFAVLVAFIFPWIVREEELMLIETFGEEYREYMRRTGRFFPRIRPSSDANE